MQADLAALWQLATAYLEWQAALALKAVPDASLPPPLQTALTLELGLFCRLQQQSVEVGGNMTLHHVGLTSTHKVYLHRALIQ